MTLSLQYEHMAYVVGMVCELADHDLADEQSALLWTVRNRLERSCTLVTKETVAEVCDQLQAISGVADASCGGWGREGFCEPVFCRVFGVFCAILASDMPDITRSAVCFHRHDTVPAWSKLSEPCALIGRYFFYSDPELPHRTKGALPRRKLGLAYI